MLSRKYISYIMYQWLRAYGVVDLVNVEFMGKEKEKYDK